MWVTIDTVSTLVLYSVFWGIQAGKKLKNFLGATLILSNKNRQGTYNKNKEVKRMITNKIYYKQVTKRIFIFAFTLLALYISFKLSVFYVPFLIAFLISLLIEPLIRKVMKITNLTRKISAIITLVVVFSIVIGLLIFGITSAITEASNILANLNNNMDEISNQISDIITNFHFERIKIPEQIKDIVQNTFQNIIGKGTDFAQKILTKLIGSVGHIPQIMICTGITILATYFVCTDKMYLLDQMEHHLPRDWVNKVGYKLRKVIASLGAYLKAQSILIGISFSIVLIGLIIFKIVGMNVKYPLMIALAIGFVDALPILGSGTVMIPWAVISAFNGDIRLAISLIILLAIMIVVRQFLEPKIVSSHIGVHPIFTLIAMYTGFQLIGVWGLFLGPIILIILKNIFETMIDNGVVKTILDRN